MVGWNFVTEKKLRTNAYININKGIIFPEKVEMLKKWRTMGEP